MSTNAYPISTPAKFIGSGDLFVLNTGNFYASPSGAITLNSGSTFNADAVGAMTLSATGALTIMAQGATSDITLTSAQNISHSAVGYHDFNTGSIRRFVITGAGGLITSTDGTTLSQLTIGTAGQVLTVNGSGMPVWQTPAGNASGAFNVNLTGANISGAASATFTTLAATWDESVAPDYDDGIFASGVFTAAADGVYDIAASIIFGGDNSGGGATFTDVPTQGVAVRQLRIRKTNGTAKTLAFASRQAEPYSGNDTHVQIGGFKVQLSANDTIAFQYRHDASSLLPIRGSTGPDTMGQTWFSVHRVR